MKIKKDSLINEETKIKEIVEKYPELIETLSEYGLKCIHCPFSNIDTIKSGLELHGLSHEIEFILKDLNSEIKKIKNGH